MTISYSFIDDSIPTPVPVPDRLPNGGLYVGTTASGPWGNAPVAPESHVLTTQNLLSANPPPGAAQQPMSTARPGNNTITHPYHAPLPPFNGVFITTRQ